MVDASNNVHGIDSPKLPSGPCRVPLDGDDGIHQESQAMAPPEDDDAASRSRRSLLFRAESKHVHHSDRAVSKADQPANARYAEPPNPDQIVQATFCGT